MTTNRTPIQRPAATPITDRALDLFEAMGRLKCSCPPPRPLAGEPCPGCRQWFDLHDLLHTELKLKPWQWPCVSRRGPKHAGDTCWNDEISARMKMLSNAAKARRTNVGPKGTTSEKEGSTDVAEPDAAGAER